jgi:hypothetical protein
MTRKATVRKGSALRAIGPERQRPSKAQATGKKTWIKTIEDVLVRIKWALSTKSRRHAFQQHLAKAGVRAVSSRVIRSDGLLNLLSVIVVLLTHSEIGQWLLADKRKGYSRPPVRELDRRAFGDLVPMERSDKRTWRALRWLTAAGFLRTNELAITDPVTGKTRAEVAVRHLRPLFFDLLGLSHLVSAFARDRDRDAGRRREERLAPLRSDELEDAALEVAGAGPFPIYGDAPSAWPWPS